MGNIQTQAENIFPQSMRDAGFTAQRGNTTAYASSSDKEAFIEAVTGTLWNYGFSIVHGFTESAGGRTGSFGSIDLTAQRYGNNWVRPTNVRDFMSSGQSLEDYFETYGDTEGWEPDSTAISLEDWIIRKVIFGEDI